MRRCIVSVVIVFGLLTTPVLSQQGPTLRTITHWAFRPLSRPQLPTTKNKRWAQSPLDHFILAKLEAAGIKPAATADKLTLIRRATFDLIGLPPTPHEIAAFLADTSPHAFAKVVDRLLDSPHYGEKWGRHWLDVARYADSNGLDENVAHGNAWRYRDYVVAAFNQDKPYDRFLVEQIAGDLLPAPDVATRHEQLIATGFLALGPKVLAEVDENKMEMDIVDEQVDTVGRAIMAMTLGCARCHDHKFDPIKTEDYYALAGIFKSTKTMENFKKVARWYENSLASGEDLARRAAHDKQLAAQKEAVASVVTKAKSQLQAAGKPLPTTAKDLEAAFPVDTQAELKRLREQLTQLEKAAPEPPSAMGVAEGAVCDVRVHIRGSCLNLGPTAPRRFPVVLAGESQPPLDAKQSGRLQFAQWLVSPDHPLTSRVMANRLWRWHCGQGLSHSTDNFGKLGEPPTHPELLDWLARQLMERGWSLKSMHRFIMMSSTYQMSSAYDAKAANLDPENRMHWRNDLRRLESEEIRDSLLAVSGALDTTMGGSLLQIKNREYFFDHTSKDMTKYDSLRRSLYLPVVRNHLYDVFQLFDSTDASVAEGDRASTTVPPQALFFMNSDLVTQAASKLAESLMWRSPPFPQAGEGRGVRVDDAARIRLLYMSAFGRLASESEVARARSFVERGGRALQGREPDPEKRRRQAWTWMCQSILSANEFVCVR